MKEDEVKNNSSGKPIISNRLPKAFSQHKHLTNKKNVDLQFVSAVGEFKKVKKLLSPLKNDSPDPSEFRKIINKLAKFPEIPEKAQPTKADLIYPLKFEELITISIVKSSCSTGTVRKSLHAPTLKLYATKEISINTMATRKRISRHPSQENPKPTITVESPTPMVAMSATSRHCSRRSDSLTCNAPAKRRSPSMPSSSASEKAMPPTRART